MQSARARAQARPMTTALLIVHALSSTLLLGAITHQALAAWWPSAADPRWWRSLRAVHAERYVAATMVLFLVTMGLGIVIYPPFVAGARAEFLDARAPWAVGLFEIKEHAAAVALALLPAYRAVWRESAPAARRAITTLLLLATWWNFVVGLLVNNVRGL